MLKLITSGPGLLLASRIACPSEPAPLLFVFVTTNVLAWATPEKINIKPIVASTTLARRGVKVFSLNVGVIVRGDFISFTLLLISVSRRNRWSFTVLPSLLAQTQWSPLV